MNGRLLGALAPFRSFVVRAEPVLRAQRVPSACAALLIATGLALLWLGTPLWWFGASFLVGAALCIWHAFRPQFSAAGAWLGRERSVLGRNVIPGERLLDVLYVGVLVWVATIMMRDVITGVRPISHDHTVHYFKAWQMHQYFLPRLRLHGYSHRWFAGYPVNYLYPIGTELFVNAVDYAGLGFLSFARAYGVAFWLFHILTGYAGYRLGRAFGGPHVGLITGFLMITDLSGFRFGGWAYTIEYGVWPQALSLVFALFATVRVPEIYETRALRPIGVFALWMGLAIVTHPIEIIYLGLLLVAAVIAGLAAPDVRAARGTARLLLAYALSALVSADWLLPFIASRKQTTPMGVWWDSTYEMGKGLINLDAFPGTIGAVLVFGTAACVILLRSRRFALMFCALMALLVPAVCNSTFIDELHLPQLSASFAKIQWLRMSTMVKPFWFAMAGYCAVAIVAKARLLGAASRSERQRSLFREVMLGMVVSLLTLPFAVPACQAFFTSNIAKALSTERDRELDRDRSDLVNWLKHNLAKDGFYRICVNTGHNHDLLDIGTIIDRPIYKRGFTPAENFIYKMNTEDNAVLEAVNVRYMIAKKYMSPDDYVPLAHFGVYGVYEFKHWNPLPYVVMHGEGDIHIEQFANDEIALRAGPGSHGKLRLNVSYFPRWHAYRDGKPIAIWPTALKQAPTSTGFMTVELAPGEYRFVFEPSALDHASFVLSLLGLALAVGFVWSGRLRLGASSLARAFERAGEWLEQLSEPRFRRLRRVSLGALGLIGFAAVVGLAEWRPPLALENLDGAMIKRVRFDFLEQLATAHVEIEYPSRVRRCRRLGDRFACRREDGNIDNEKYVASTPAEIEEYRMVRCIRARPEDNARLNLFYPDVPSGDAIVGYYGIERAGRMMRLSRPVNFTVRVDGQQIYDAATISDNHMHWFEAKVGGPSRHVGVMFSVSAANVQRRFFCFYAQMADLSRGQTKPPARRSVGDTDEPE